MSTELMELSLIVFGMLVAHLGWHLRKAQPVPQVAMAEVVELAQYRQYRQRHPSLSPAFGRAVPRPPPSNGSV